MKRLYMTAMLTASLAASAQESTYSKYIQAVDEFVPAPGQFINDKMPAYEEGDTPETMAQKCTERLADNARQMISLGAFGGYITFHFDHSVANVEGKRDFYIAGNAYTGNSEPGIVMVSQDVNKNGLPDDEWYELSGSADVDSAGLVVYNYEVTYRKDPMKDVPWTDNQGRTGVVNRNTFHSQEYYPLWLPDEMTFRGTLLPQNGFDTSGRGSYFVMSALRQGYVDNVANTDTLGCSFDISWAVDENRQPVRLASVDFIRVYTAVQQVCGWIGELSTEVAGAEDLHLDESIAAMTGIAEVKATNAEAAAYYTMDGKRRQNARPGLNIVRMKNGKTLKQFFQ